MMKSWVGDGSRFEVEWGGRIWALELDRDRPGLYSSEHGAGPLLGLNGLAAVGRLEDAAFTRDTLHACETHGARVTAIYAPPGWGDLTLQARWTLRSASVLDLELEISARSVGELRAVEAFTVSRIGSGSDGGELTAVPRDARCAGLSYDGRESSVSQLTTVPPRGLDRPQGWEGLVGNAHYLEFAHPHDESRTVLSPQGAVRHAFFGYDLERGVVLRGRLRGMWVDPSADRSMAVEAFLSEPPPLTT